MEEEPVVVVLLAGIDGPTLLTQPRQCGGRKKQCCGGRRGHQERRTTKIHFRLSVVLFSIVLFRHLLPIIAHNPIAVDTHCFAWPIFYCLKMRRCCSSVLLLLLLLSVLPFVKCSCCCGGCCGGGGDCCCCCCGNAYNNNNNNNAAAMTGIGAGIVGIGSALLANAAQAAVPPTDLAVGRAAALGPELFPDGSTGRRAERLGEIGIENGGGGVYFPVAGRRHKRTPGVGKLDTMMDQLNFDPMFPGSGGSAGGMNQQNPFSNDPPGLGPGLLPDGSTGRRKAPQNGAGFSDFFDGMNFDGMHSPTQRRQQKRCSHSKLDNKRHSEQLRMKRCACGSATTKFEMVEVDPNLLQNYTIGRFLLGLVPRELAQSKRTEEKSDTDSPSPDSWTTDNSAPLNSSSLSAEINAQSSASTSSTASSEENNSSSASPAAGDQQQRFRPSSSTVDVEDKKEPTSTDLLVGRRLFLIPPIGSISGRKKREAAPSPSSLQFYRPMVPNPENADEELGVDDYD